MSNRPIFVDPHVHLWDLSHLRYPWLTPPFETDNPNGSVEPIAVDYPLDAYLADAGNWTIAGIVHIDAGADPRDALRETGWLQAMADERAMPNGIVGFAALNDPELEPLLAKHVEHRNLRGIRHIVNWHEDPTRSYATSDVTKSAEWQAGFALLAKYGLRFDLQAYPAQFDHLAELFSRHPNIPVILNHTGMMVGLEGQAEWLEGMKKLAALPHVAVKMSGMGFVERPWTMEMARHYILQTIDVFGTHRAMFASNFPTDKLFGSFEQHLDAYNAITANFSGDERHALFAGNANTIYALGLNFQAPE